MEVSIRGQLTLILVVPAFLFPARDFHYAAGSDPLKTDTRLRNF